MWKGWKLVNTRVNVNGGVYIPLDNLQLEVMTVTIVTCLHKWVRNSAKTYANSMNKLPIHHLVALPRDDWPIRTYILPAL
jgi:hypothetical protein